MTQQTPFISSQAALIATFYGSHGELESLANLLLKGLGEREQGIKNWQDVERLMFLRHFDPPGASDTSIIQVALSTPENIAVGDAWKTMCWRLGRVLSDESLKSVWGYSLIYQAVVQSDTGSLPDFSNKDNQAALKELLQNAQRLRADPPEIVPILTQANVAGGQIWLTRIPRQRDGLEAATVYVALGLGGEEQDKLIEEVLYGPNAALLMPDLIAHKGYRERRQYYQNNIKKRYEDFVETLRQMTTDLLPNLENSEGSRHARRNATLELDKLNEKYHQLQASVLILDKLRVSLVRQVHNYEWWRTHANGGDVLFYHKSHLETTHDELELLVTMGRDTLDGVTTTLNMVQTGLDRAQATRQETMQNWLTILGVALAVPQIVDRRVVGKLLAEVGIPTSQDADLLLLFAVQAAITLAVLLLVRFVVKRRGR